MKKLLLIIPMLLMLTGCFDVENATTLTKDGTVLKLENIEVRTLEFDKVETDIITYNIEIEIKNITENELEITTGDYSFAHDEIKYELQDSSLLSQETTVLTMSMTAKLDDEIKLSFVFFDINDISLIIYLEEYN